jgi:hypothetical protein
MSQSNSELAKKYKIIKYIIESDGATVEQILDCIPHDVDNATYNASEKPSQSQKLSQGLRNAMSRTGFSSIVKTEKKQGSFFKEGNGKGRGNKSRRNKSKSRSKSRRR